MSSAPRRSLSHRSSRQEVGLADSGVPTIEFRASTVIGSGLMRDVRTTAWHPLPGFTTGAGVRRRIRRYHP